ncbi:PEP-CTERM sorting domain-containing protein [Botrimarina hoheduenensis]|uniref:PEP-CTERM motif protein n=1 Tax=Botrimarina hoheduenensis TaxID=2528000 RepID=A0A5C5VRB1_9BACT|nr:PEP-CTERM sorting domain-containing protein [Botrimarina hoheduenensis]TWT40687.1 PEP-CTERM motif protein [Botrimarina hoheduenensis]
MTRTLCFAALLGAGCVANGATLTISALDVRSNGVFGHDANVGTAASQQGGSGTVLINGGNPTAAAIPADPLDIQVIYSGLDLDGDSTPNDTVTFTLRVAKFGTDGGALRAFNQGVDTGFGNLNDVEVSMLSWSGTTTDFGAPIVFDGFTGAAAGMGAGAAFTRNVDINGTTVNLSTTGAGFEFPIAALDFLPVPTVRFDNSGGTGGSIVARHYDLQFSASAIPEPSTFVLLGLVACGLAACRRR